MRVLIVACLLVGSRIALSQAQAELPPSGVVSGQRDLETISFLCHFLASNGDSSFTPTNQISCEFSQLALSIPSAAEIAKKVTDDLADFDATRRKEGNKIAREMRASCQQAGFDKEFDHERKLLALNNHADALVSDLDRQRDTLKRMCDKVTNCKDSECTLAAARELTATEAQASAQACRVWSHSYKLKFQRAGTGWSSVITNSTCHLSETTTLTHPSDTKERSFWEMRTVSVPRPEAATMLLCDHNVDDSIDSWRPYGPIRLSCPTIKLGP